ncbi:hypothetical protein ENSA5_02880 [Enhygromyxa salina]|uniref:Uncharacterized protein n=1 Tax=Enhygromyxa salina TaxID=215803 RepID=A0A2S9YJL3_9BACT|nr:hypothetical protein [Enhygromyxa salina]PRQ05298.1 hypothetical protein ENSA5_02880 [Enhygromyxa salina]
MDTQTEQTKRHGHKGTLISLGCLTVLALSAPACDPGIDNFDDVDERAALDAERPDDPEGAALDPEDGGLADQEEGALDPEDVQWATSADASAQVHWVPATQPSCDNTCQAVSLSPVASGKYVNGFDFYVCSGNAYGEGYRAGFNLRPAWANACIVGWGGKSIFVSPYRCLCR